MEKEGTVDAGESSSNGPEGSMRAEGPAAAAEGAEVKAGEPGRPQAEHQEEEEVRAVEEGFVLAPLSRAAVLAAPNRKWRCVQVEKRSVTFFHHDGQVFAMDSWCYHNGGALARGDIEDFGGRLAVRCPLHSYRISLDTGEGLYMGLESDVKSKGVKQRVHPVRIIGDKIYIKISKPKQPNSPEIQSDCFQHLRI